eukprot:TRINITY_DN19037_c0_g1_i3.p1 TRINITY_DN19037_c0_g1~~TRINITY_DN19037_c0_g1_i3.p1  ORF type:complete len:365 (+),score=36.85 TRINITY_DN19037_c0_g1_i3:395-1489(+)
MRWRQMSESFSRNSGCDSDGFPCDPSPSIEPGGLEAPGQNTAISPLHQLQRNWKNVHNNFLPRPFFGSATEVTPSKLEAEERCEIPFSVLHGWREEGIGPRTRVYSATWCPAQGTRADPRHDVPLEVAVKKMHGSKNMSATSMAVFRKEVGMLQELEHPNVLPILATCVEEAEVAIVLPLWGKGTVDLHSVIRQKHAPLGARRMVHVALGVASGLLYLHSRQPAVVHGHLHTRNIVLEGHATFVSDYFELPGASESEQYHGVGMPQWQAPEIIMGHPAVTSCDVYSFAMVLFEMADGGLPFRNEFETPLAAAFAAVSGSRPKLSRGAAAHPGAIELMRTCWEVDPATRPDANHLVKVLKELTNS